MFKYVLLKMMKPDWKVEAVLKADAISAQVI